MECQFDKPLTYHVQDTYLLSDENNISYLTKETIFHSIFQHHYIFCCSKSKEMPRFSPVHQKKHYTDLHWHSYISFTPTMMGGRGCLGVVFGVVSWQGTGVVVLPTTHSACPSSLGRGKDKYCYKLSITYVTLATSLFPSSTTHWIFHL